MQNLKLKMNYGALYKIFDFYFNKTLSYNIKIYYRNIYNIVGKYISQKYINFILKKLEILILKKSFGFIVYLIITQAKKVLKTQILT